MTYPFISISDSPQFLKYILFKKKYFPRRDCCFFLKKDTQLVYAIYRLLWKIKIEGHRIGKDYLPTPFIINHIYLTYL